mgnify:FL=1
MVALLDSFIALTALNGLSALFRSQAALWSALGRNFLGHKSTFMWRESISSSIDVTSSYLGLTVFLLLLQDVMSMVALVDS